MDSSRTPQGPGTLGSSRPAEPLPAPVHCSPHPQQGSPSLLKSPAGERQVRGQAPLPGPRTGGMAAHYTAPDALCTPTPPENCSRACTPQGWEVHGRKELRRSSQAEREGRLEWEVLLLEVHLNRDHALSHANLTGGCAHVLGRSREVQVQQPHCMLFAKTKGS